MRLYQKTSSNNQDTMEKTAGLMRHLFVAPRPILLVIPVLLLAFLSGIILFNDNLNPFYFVFIHGFFLFAIPTFLSVILSTYFAGIMKEIFYLRRSMLLSIICLLIIFFILIIARFLIIPIFNVQFTVFILFSYVSIIWLRYLVFISIVTSSKWKALILSSIQPILDIVFYSFFYPLNNQDYWFITLLFLIFLISVYMFVELINIPMRKNFKVNGLKILNYFFHHITENSKVEEIESFFDSFAEKVDIPIRVVAFKTDMKLKALIIVPSVHPGPFGTLGGSNLPQKLSERLKNLSDFIMVPHGASTHDYNLCVSDDCDKISKKVYEIIKSMDFNSEGGPFVRFHEDLDICAQKLGKGIILVYTSSPNSTDDIDPSIEENIHREIEKIGLKNSLFIDAHNCLEIGIDSVFLYSKKSYTIQDLAKNAAIESVKKSSKQLKIGIAQKKDFDLKTDGIGPKGIQVLTLDVKGIRNSYILFDGNNMVKGLREKIINEIKSIIDQVEILTSDNHIVNIQFGGYNPIGNKIKHQTLIDICKLLVKESIEDLEECNIGIEKDIIENIRIFGQGNTSRITSTITSIISTLKLNLLCTLSLGFLFSIVLYLMIYL